MYRMQQLEKEIDEIEAEISKQEARLAKEDVPKEVSSPQLKGGRWEELPDSYQAISNTKFAEVLRRECMVVIKTSYFTQCLKEGQAFADRSNIPAEFKYSGEEAFANWEKYGNMFLVVLSYSWLSKKHPDPNLFHLRILVPLLDQVQAYFRKAHADLPELGIIIDYCSLWQNLSENENEDSRSAEQYKEFLAGLKCINTPYAHQDVTAIKLTCTPLGEVRTYELRGWTFFESRVIDGCLLYTSDAADE